MSLPQLRSFEIVDNRNLHYSTSITTMLSIKSWSMFSKIICHFTSFGNLQYYKIKCITMHTADQQYSMLTTARTVNMSYLIALARARSYGGRLWSALNIIYIFQVFNVILFILLSIFEAHPWDWVLGQSDRNVSVLKGKYHFVINK